MGFFAVIIVVLALSMLTPRSVLAQESEISGFLMLDYSGYDGVYRSDDNNGGNLDIRRARVTLDHEFGDDWSTQLDIKFDHEENTAEIRDAYIRYEGIDGIDFIVGQRKEPFGLEKITNSRNIIFLERSMMTDAFAPGRSRGIALYGSPGDFTWSVGAYNVDAEEIETDSRAITGRVTWAPLDSPSQTLHFGLAGSRRSLNGDIHEIKESGEVRGAETIVRSSEIATDIVDLLGIEAAWTHGPFSLQSEYAVADIAAMDSSEDAVLDGYYLQASYFLTGDSRRYNNGAFRAVRPNSEHGAWELTARYSALDTRETTRGDKAETTTLGLNYYHDDHIRVTLNLKRSSTTDEGQGNAVSLRLQYRF
jgi:phosphate-selective porin OprO/OprP